MKETIAALTRLVEEQGKQIVELSKALAIAHEHHSAPVPAHPMYVGPSDHGVTPVNKLYYSEQEEDELWDTGELPAKDTEAALSEILAAAGLNPTVTTN